ncbi:MAG: VOC family protein [Pseudomonadota bacterium]
MKFVNPLPFVEDVDASKLFYTKTLGLVILEDHGNFVLFEGGFAIHYGAALFKTVFGSDNASTGSYGRANLGLYFEHYDLDAAFARISPTVELIHEIRKEPWGQRVFRFYDPDRHVIEVGEPQ